MLQRSSNRENDALKGYVESLKDTNEKLFDMLAEADGKLISALDTLKSVSEQLAAKDKELAELRKQQFAPVPMVGNAPLYMSEQEEDLRWQVENGQITEQELKEILRAANLENTEIELS